MSKQMPWAILAAALLAPVAAQASGTRPDNRAGLRGAEPTQLASVRPDNRAGIRGIGTPGATTVAVRPDDRAGIRASGTNRPATVTVRPDDRAGARGAAPATASPVRADDPVDLQQSDVVDRYLNRHAAGPQGSDVVDRYLNGHADLTASSP